jgi:hypothetical protein
MQLHQTPRVLSHSRSLPILLLFAIVCALTPSARSQDVLTYHDNNARTGLDNEETILTLANVNYNTFGLLFIAPADGHVDAEPLYLSSVSVAGATHNLLIVATENDTVYAYDADTGANLWQITTLLPGEVASDNLGCNLISPTIGITSTPVISRPPTGDPVIYVVAMSKDTSGNYYQRLHALDATSGAELYGGPATITGQYPGTGDDSSGGFVIFDPEQYAERASLLLVNNTVYLAWASHCDSRPYTGWVMGYNATTLEQTTILNLTPNADRGAIWNSGGGMAADSKGNIFLAQANGVFDTTLNAGGFPDEGDYGNALLRLSTKGGLAVADYWVMYNQSVENPHDSDLGSGGAILLTEKDSTGKIWDLALAAGKDENLYIVNRENMGKYNSTRNNIYQELTDALPGSIFSTPAAINSSVYYCPKNSPILKFEFSDAKLVATTIKTTTSFISPGATPSISSNAGKNSIVWASQNTDPAILDAYNATTLVELYDSTQAPNGRDSFGVGNKYITPMIANGKVYVGTTNGVGAFGLLPAPTKNQEKK